MERCLPKSSSEEDLRTESSLVSHPGLQSCRTSSTPCLPPSLLPTFLPSFLWTIHKFIYLSQHSLLIYRTPLPRPPLSLKSGLCCVALNGLKLAVILLPVQPGIPSMGPCIQLEPALFTALHSLPLLLLKIFFKMCECLSCMYTCAPPVRLVLGTVAVTQGYQIPWICHWCHREL